MSTVSADSGVPDEPAVSGRPPVGAGAVAAAESSVGAGAVGAAESAVGADAAAVTGPAVCAAEAAEPSVSAATVGEVCLFVCLFIYFDNGHAV